MRASLDLGARLALTDFLATYKHASSERIFLRRLDFCGPRPERLFLFFSNSRSTVLVQEMGDNLLNIGGGVLNPLLLPLI
jgi:hypothetical protein